MRANYTISRVSDGAPLGRVTLDISGDGDSFANCVEAVKFAGYGDCTGMQYAAEFTGYAAQIEVPFDLVKTVVSLLNNKYVNVLNGEKEERERITLEETLLVLLLETGLAEVTNSVLSAVEPE